eukprot:3049187-Heterocapsa_arctica.AAC.1
MNRQQKADTLRWMKNNPEQKENAAMAFDRELMKEPDTPMNAMTSTTSIRLYDVVINNHVAHRRNPPWHPLDRWGNQVLGWYPWGTLKKHLLDERVCGELTDKTIWNAITQTINYQGRYHSFLIKIIRNNW